MARNRPHSRELRRRVLRAIEPSKWDASNRVLYKLCREHPLHTEDGDIVAKILLIGRVYAAAIERRRPEAQSQGNDRFYVETVAPAIRRSAIDRWLRRAKAALPGTPEGLRDLIEVHGLTTHLFSQISHLQKRSLASKYLHFHVPQLFFIYDSRAVTAIREFSNLLPGTARTDGRGDHEYRKFAGKCAALVTFCEKEFGLHLLPRQLDNLLLRVHQ